MSHLTLHLFGPPRVQRNGLPVRIPGQALDGQRLVRLQGGNISQRIADTIAPHAEETILPRHAPLVCRAPVIAAIRVEIFGGRAAARADGSGRGIKQYGLPRLRTWGGLGLLVVRLFRCARWSLAPTSLRLPVPSYCITRSRTLRQPYGDVLRQLRRLPVRPSASRQPEADPR